MTTVAICELTKADKSTKADKRYILTLVYKQPRKMGCTQQFLYSFGTQYNNFSVTKLVDEKEDESFCIDEAYAVKKRNDD